MKMNRFRLLLLAPALALSLLLPTAALGASAQAIALHQSDVPKGFHQVSAQKLTNALAAKQDGISVTELQNHGRITAFTSTFTSSSKTFFKIQDEIDVFKAASGSHWDYDRSIKSLRAQMAAAKLKLHAITMPRLGDEAIGFTIRQKTKSVDITYVLAAFRHGRYDGEVTGIGATGKINPQTIIHLISVMEHRT